MGAYWRRKSVIAGIVFILLVIISGVALNASGNMRNPFAALTGRGGFEGGRGGEGFGGRPGEGNAPQGNAGQGGATTEQRPQRLEGERGGREGGGIQWSALGTVLYDIWFLFAFSAVIMVLNQVIKGAKKLLRRGSNSPPNNDLTVVDST